MNIFCPKCGEKITSDTLFCPNCGLEIRKLISYVGDDIDSFNISDSKTIQEPQLGMMWYIFFTKVRPWIGIVLNIFTIISVLIVLIECVDMSLIIIFSAVPIVLYVFETILQFLIFIKSKEKSFKYFKLIRFTLIYEVIISILFCIIQQIGQWDNIFVAVGLVAFVATLEYFIWYRCNMKYFKKRLPNK